MNIVKRAALYVARKKFCRSAIEEHADFKEIREKPSASVIAGLVLIAFSYAIGLPAVIVLGILAVWLKVPLLGVVGAPLTYAVSTIVFIIGIRLAGRKVFVVFSKWAVRVILGRILGEDVRAVCDSRHQERQVPGESV